MNLYDFDKTIYRKDSSVQFLFFCVKKKPVLIFHLFLSFFFLILNKIKFMPTKTFKEKYFSFLKRFDNIDEVVTEFWKKETKRINKWYLSQCKEDDVICSASPEFLVKACFTEINPNAKIIATIMDKNTGKIEGENCKGKVKVARLLEGVEVENEKPLFESAYSDSISDLPMLDLAENRYIVCGSGASVKPYKFGQQKPTLLQKIVYYIKLLRIPHYIKNGLILVPLFFSKNLFNWQSVSSVLLGFLSFCLISSFVYIVNDLLDVKKDRLHSTKRERPIACYMVKVYEAIILAVLLLAGSVCINIFALQFNYWLLAIIIVYAVMNLAYSLFLKNFAIVDVFVLALCYILRLFYGGLVISVDISSWLYLTVLAASLFMGFSKRRNEIKNEGSSTRKVSKLYNYSFLDKNTYLCLAMTLVFYSLWAYNASLTYNFVNRVLLLASIVLVYFILMKYSKNIESDNNSGNPIEVLLKDWFLILCVCVYLVVMLVALYFPIEFAL
ncbi:MAG: UbiA family prenyltransferase [Clostridia bacterium]|nr:UbiA family prenyltransferase [Clostridia bacterium]